MEIISEKDWYYAVKNNWDNLPSFLEYFNKEANESKQDLKMSGRLEEQNAKLPVITEKRFGQLQICNALLEYFEIELKKEKSILYRKYLENYNRALVNRDIEKYIDGEESVIALSCIINEIALVRNFFAGIIKGLDSKAFSLSNISKLRNSGLEDATIE